MSTLTREQLPTVRCNDQCCGAPENCNPLDSRIHVNNTRGLDLVEHERNRAIKFTGAHTAHPDGAQFSAAHDVTCFSKNSRRNVCDDHRATTAFQECSASCHPPHCFTSFAATMECMPDYRFVEQKIRDVLGSDRRPVAVAYLDAPPAGIPKFEGSEPSSCSFWRLAAAGRTFYTVPADHFNCPVGSYTHNTLTPEKMPELNDVLQLMTGIGYIRMEEIPGVFQLPAGPKVVVYAPLGETPVAPSVVLVSGRPGRIMLLAEAANRARAMSQLPLLGRPTCMALPAALAQGAVTSSGCIGNRVYTDIGEDELYFILRGADIERIAAEISTICSANETLTGYHRERRQALSSALLDL